MLVSARHAREQRINYQPEVEERVPHRGSLRDATHPLPGKNEWLELVLMTLLSDSLQVVQEPRLH